MRFRRLDLNLLAALECLIRLRSVSRAAEEMSMTQSAMSNALNRLRLHFDDPLLVQIGRKMELTPRAEALAGPVNDILLRIETSVIALPEFDPATAIREVRVVVSDYSLHVYIPPFLRRIAGLAPGITFDFRPQQAYPQTLLERGDADLLIAPGLYCSPDHPMEQIAIDPLVFVVDAAHPCAMRGLTCDDVTAAEHVAMKPALTGESYATIILREAGLPIRNAISTFAFSAIPEIVRGTRRIALLHRRLAEQMARGGGLVLLEPPLALPPLAQHVQWHSLRDNDQAIIWLRQHLLASVE